MKKISIFCLLIFLLTLLAIYPQSKEKLSQKLFEAVKAGNLEQLKILVEKGRAVGVRLENGEIVNSRCVLANTDPKRTFLKLLDSDQLDAEFVKDIRQIRMGHSSLRINLALKGLPNIRFFAPSKAGPWHRSDICISQNVEGLEANFFPPPLVICPKHHAWRLRFPPQ